MADLSDGPCGTSIGYHAPSGRCGEPGLPESERRADDKPQRARCSLRRTAHLEIALQEKLRVPPRIGVEGVAHSPEMESGRHTLSPIEPGGGTGESRREKRAPAL